MELVLGILVFFWGFIIIMTGTLPAGHIDFFIKPVRWSSGLIFIGTSFYIIFLSIKKIIKKRRETQADKELHKPLICPICMNHYYKNEIKTLKCPNCKEPLITLSEYVENKKYRKEDDVSK